MDLPVGSRKRSVEPRRGPDGHLALIDQRFGVNLIEKEPLLISSDSKKSIIVEDLVVGEYAARGPQNDVQLGKLEQSSGFKPFEPLMNLFKPLKLS